MKTDEKLVIVVRQDLRPGQQASQIAHTMTEFMVQYPESARSWYAQSNTLVLLAAKDEHELQRISDKAFDLGVQTATFKEPDLGNAITGIALEPSSKNHRICRGLPMALGG
jgi:peptidyl-tRNA hydrolase